MKKNEIQNLLDKISNVKIALYGDFCLDAYWTLDPRGSEVSVETGLQAEAVASQKYSLGGASNVAANLAALKPAAVKIFGVRGSDIFAKEMVRQLDDLGIDTSGLVIQQDNFDTYTFSKRILEGEEQPRIDFGFRNKRSLETDKKIIENLRTALKDIDVILLNQQVPGSITNESFIDDLNALIAEFPEKTFILDSRHYAAKFKNVSLKLNDIEAAALNGVSGEAFGAERIEVFATSLHEKNKKPVFVTRGAKGLLACNEDGIFTTNGIQLLKQIDSVGAGDTAFSAIAAALAGGANLQQVIEFANFAAAVTVQKLYQTGVASPEEIIELGADPDYIYQPELAEDIRQAKYIEDTEIELCTNINNITTGKIKHAVFDHDGTVSVLREGWEKVMEPVMVKAVLGDQYDTVDEATYQKVVTQSQEFIEKTTGIQTIVQMELLVDMVKHFGFVPEDKILDKFGYKEIYNDALMEMVREREAKLRSGELSVEDFAVKNAVEVLHKLRERGVTLYLASGTDVEDVKNEAQAMGYADLFNGGIYGSVGDVSKYSKKMVIDNIITSNNLHGAELITFGDGPVEIRETRKQDGITVGVASDEVRRHGMNIEKRTRLIKAGADFIIPDFSQYKKLFKVLFDE